MNTVYLLMKLRHDGANGIPKIVDARIFSEPAPSILGFEFSYAELARMDGENFSIAVRNLRELVRQWPYMRWVFQMPGMQGR